jgi:hypothetical protein
MRKSRVLLAGVAVAAAAAATSAFTASNTVDNSVAGYGQGTVSGAHISNFHYVANAADGTIVDSIEFDADKDLTNNTVTLTLKKLDGSVPPVEVVAHTPYDCDVKTAWNTTKIVMTCDTTGDTLNFEDFDMTGVTVLQ